MNRVLIISPINNKGFLALVCCVYIKGLRINLMRTVLIMITLKFDFMISIIILSSIIISVMMMMIFLVSMNMTIIMI